MSRSFCSLGLFCALVLVASACTRSRGRTGTPPPRDSGSIGLDGGDRDTGSSTGGETRTFVVSAMDIGQADPAGDPNIVPGFDLDGLDSDEFDAAGCFKPDFRSPPPDNESGVDNQMGPILASLGGSFDVSGSIADAIAAGDLLTMIEIRNLNDPVSDDSVEIELFDGAALSGVVLDASGRLAPGQTFSVVRSLGTATGSVVNGRARAVGFDLALAIATDPTASFALTSRNSELRFDLAGADLRSGVLGGSLDVEETITAIVMAVMDVPEMLARSILEGQADLQPDPGGQCRAVSVAYVLEGVPAFRD